MSVCEQAEEEKSQRNEVSVYAVYAVGTENTLQSGSYERGRGIFCTACWHHPTHIEEGRYARITMFSGRVLWWKGGHLIRACCHCLTKILSAPIFNYSGGCHMPLTNEGTCTGCTSKSQFPNVTPPGPSVRNSPRTAWRFHHRRVMSTGCVAGKATKRRKTRDLTNDPGCPFLSAHDHATVSASQLAGPPAEVERRLA